MNLSEALKETGLEKISFKNVKTYRKNRREGLQNDIDISSKKVGYSVTNGSPRQINIHNFKSKEELKDAYNRIVNALNNSNLKYKSTLKNDITPLIFVFK